MDIFLNILYYSFTAIYAYIAIIIIITILMENRNPVKSLAWIMIMLLLPIVGIIFFIFFGQNYRKKKIIQNKLKYLPLTSDCIYDIDNINSEDMPKRFQKLAKMLHTNGGSQLFNGGKIDVLTTGTDTFDALFNDLMNAKEHIHIEFYIIENDEVGNKLCEILSQKAKEGIRVRLIYDYLGGWHLPPFWKKNLIDSGVFVQPFLATNSLRGFSMINYRNHRKLVIIDGKIGYTGGVNIAERYRKGNRLGRWRDTFMRLEGAAVHAMQYSFLVDWNFVDGKAITDKKYYPEPGYYEDNFIQIVSSGPDTDWPTIMQGIISAIAIAEKEIFIHTPYFIPPDSIITALETAALSGVDVRILTPQHSDSPLVSAASRSYFEELMKSGIKVYFYKYNFLHSKAIVIDRCLSIIGTANMDNRSYEQDYEISAFIYDTKTADTLVDNYLKDLNCSKELNINLWHHRPKIKKFAESLARLFSPLL